MLLAGMILVVGVTSAQLPSTTITPPRPTQSSLERTSVGTANTQPNTGTSQLKPTSKMFIPSASTLPATLLDETSPSAQYTIPLNSTLQFRTPGSARIATSTNKTTLPSSVTKSILSGSMKGTPEDTVRKSIHQFSTASLRATIEVPRTTFLQSNTNTNVPKLSSKVRGHTVENFNYGYTKSIYPTKPRLTSTYLGPTKSLSPNSSRSSDQTKSTSTSAARYQSTTTVATKMLADKQRTETPVTLKTVDKLDIPIQDSTIQGILSSQSKTRFPSTATTTSAKPQTTAPAKMPATRKSFIISPGLPLPTEPLPSATQKHTRIPPNTVESMHNLPWNNQETTSVFLKKDFDSILHPTLPPVFSQRTIPPKKDPLRDMNRTTTSSPLTSLRPSFKSNDKQPNYYRYNPSASSQGVTSRPPQTTLPISPVLDFQGNQSVLRTTVSPIGGASKDNSKTLTVTHRLKNSSKNQLVLHSTSLPTGSASFDDPKLPPGVPQHPQKTSDENQSVFQSRSSSKVPVIVPSLPFKTSSDTLPLEILPTLAAVDSVIENLTENCKNDYCVSDEDYIERILIYIFPTSNEWVMIGMHAIVFVGGLIGNALVCVAVYRNHSMRTVTNYFIVNLAVADFLVILLCLPPSVVWDVTETWFMGTALCKIVLYFQTVSVAVSVLTLTFISVDRWYAICCPLKFKSTTGRAKTAILVIWVLALAFDIPELVVLQTTQKELSIDTLLLTQCGPSWSDKTDMAFHCLKTLLLYTIPLVFMSVAYYQIVKVLWSSDNIPGHKERLDPSVASCRSNTITTRKKIDRCTSVTVSTTGQVICRRKAAKMLVAVVIVFAVCNFPVHLLSILRYTVVIPQTDATTAFAMVSHWLFYANSALNPLIYNFMSGKFRKEFAHAFGCRRVAWKHLGAFARRRRRQTVGACGEIPRNGRCGAQRAEMLPLSGGCATNIVIDGELSC